MAVPKAATTNGAQLTGGAVGFRMDAVGPGANLPQVRAGGAASGQRRPAVEGRRTAMGRTGRQRCPEDDKNNGVGLC